MIRSILPALAIAAGLSLSATPVSAQGKTLIIYGNDKCPEGVICVRQSESERYRIPPTLRSGTLAPADQPWAARSAGTLAAGGDHGPGPCTNVGGGGGSNCFQNTMRQARAEAAQTKAEVAASPIPK